MGAGSYRWWNLSRAEQTELLARRRQQHQPWHGPQHRLDDDRTRFHLTAACYEHQPLIGHSLQRLADFATSLTVAVGGCGQLHAWCVLPNHYHALVTTGHVRSLLSAVGGLHGRSSHAWNGEESTRGRKVFYGSVERAIRSEAHFWATLNYIHHNPVRHGYVAEDLDWPWSSAADFAAAVGPSEVDRIWRDYPVLDYGRGWDCPAL